MRTLFPGHKLSSLWCRSGSSELPFTAPVLPPMPPSQSNRFYSPENLERVSQHAEAAKLSMLDNELDIRMFRILCTRKYDLWERDEFAAAVQVLAALQMYLLNGSVRCGALQVVFSTGPYTVEDSVSENETEERDEVGNRGGGMGEVKHDDT